MDTSEHAHKKSLEIKAFRFVGHLTSKKVMAVQFLGKTLPFDFVQTLNLIKVSWQQVCKNHEICCEPRIANTVHRRLRLISLSSSQTKVGLLSGES